ncbi:MAG: hypothetical protein MJE68_15485, partial [Proteobacteria bacterium]|nr:hypothetical protein [Pseudomonadota bacterium]
GVYKAVAANSHGSDEREIKLTVNEEGGASTAVAVGDVVSSRPIPIPEFGEYVANLHANSNQPFKDLFEVGALHNLYYVKYTHTNTHTYKAIMVMLKIVFKIEGKLVKLCAQTSC